jgi:hypothetical protein
MPKPLRRTLYRDRLPPHNVRPGQATHAEIALDVENYYEPLLEALASAHSPGVISGLRVIFKEGTTDVTVQPGIAIDGLGRVIVLSETGRAEIGANADAPNASAQLVDATDKGVRFPTAGLSGNKLLLIRWWETFDEQGFSDAGTLRSEHTPWLQVVSFDSFEDAERLTADKTRIALAILQLGAGADAGKLTGGLPLAQPRVRIDHELAIRRISLKNDDVVAGDTVGTFSTMFGNVGSMKLAVLEPGLVIEAKQVQIDGNLEVTGDAQFRGHKVGFVADEFHNATDTELERGDLVVLTGEPIAANNDSLIPVPRVERSSTAYDKRLCGVVSAGAAAGAEGRMVTLGCWAHCKVDADLGAIETGDLLTTSPTPGHAQKASDASRAPGAVLGKALAPLGSGRGIIPMLVSLH